MIYRDLGDKLVRSTCYCKEVFFIVNVILSKFCEYIKIPAVYDFDILSWEFNQYLSIN